MTFRLSSPLFDEGARIPTSAAHTYAGGENVSPELTWVDPPEGTASFALTCHDPDAPTDIGFVHWVMFNIPGDARGLAAGAGAAGAAPSRSTLGFTDWGSSEWGGMAPPPGDDPHHYTFTVYALDVAQLDLPPTTTYAFLRFNSGPHVLRSATLIGRFGLPA